MSSRKLDLTDAAERDIRGILQLSRRAWGVQQRNRYERQVGDALDRLSQYPDLGQRVDQISIGLRAQRVGQHIIYYRITEQEIRVFRVLHAKMDAAAQLGAESS